MIYTLEEAQEELKDYSFNTRSNTNPVEKFTDVRYGNAKAIVDEIFAGFDARTCENCKHWKQENQSQKSNDKGMCNQHSDKDKYYAIGITHNDFGCNRWEK